MIFLLGKRYGHVSFYRIKKDHRYQPVVFAWGHHAGLYLNPIKNAYFYQI